MQPAPDQASRPVSPAQPQKAAESGQADRVRFVQRVADAFRAIGDRNGSLRLRLSPPELGSLRLEISVRHGVMTARVEAETSTARNLLLDNLPALRDRLEQLDIKIQQFDVDLMDRSPGGLADRWAGQMESDQHGQDSNAPRPGRETVAETETTPGLVAVHWPGKGTQLNVVI
ncbi:MAG: hypothetical protein A2V70_11930 [Planctomycetes bacterium RBG_13_63_9]|nr:MAG: hypothetical protein A2V70_11930 [Planctomycetes bacterium RBG_13_63_9]